jgi:hypothetical protein
MGSIPLLWNLENSVLRNILRLLAAAPLLFAFNVVRLELGHVLYYWGAPWTAADQVLGGLAYFAVWLSIWRLRSWKTLRGVAINFVSRAGFWTDPQKCQLGPAARESS